MRRWRAVIFGAVLLCHLTLLAGWARQERDAASAGGVIRGRVVDPHGLRPEGAILLLGREDDGAFSATPVAVTSDGSFRTSRVPTGTYVLKVVRTPHSATKPAMDVAYEIVRVGTRDVDNVTVTVRRDTALTGTFRVETDDPAAQWPAQIVVNAFLALDGLPMLDGVVPEGAPAGKFVLRNAFGPRVLRCGYSRAADGGHWWPSRVTLDGVDITNTPIDFSEREHARLEVWFTKHPARIAGTVVGAGNEPVWAPWILVRPASPHLRQAWAVSSEVTQGNTKGVFSVAVLPGTYLVEGMPQERFRTYQDARRRLLQLESGGERVEVAARERKTVTLTAKP
jgi:hypothetical protein